MKNKTLIALIFFYLPFIANSQTDSTYTLSGTVVTGNTNIPLRGAHLLTSKKSGTKTSETGEFSITVSHNDTISVSYIGYKTINYIAPKRDNGKYLTKFKLYRDSIILDEVEIFPYPTYKEFKEAFIAMNKENEKIKMEGINMYIDESNEPIKPSILNPASFIYDKLFDKKAKMKRRLDRRRNLIKTERK